MEAARAAPGGRRENLSLKLAPRTRRQKDSLNAAFERFYREHVADRRNGDAEHLGDLGVAAIFDLADLDRGTLVEGQPRERAQDLVERGLLVVSRGPGLPCPRQSPCAAQGAGGGAGHRPGSGLAGVLLRRGRRLDRGRWRRARFGARAQGRGGRGDGRACGRPRLQGGRRRWDSRPAHGSARAGARAAPRSDPASAAGAHATALRRRRSIPSSSARRLGAGGAAADQRPAFRGRRVRIRVRARCRLDGLELGGQCRQQRRGRSPAAARDRRQPSSR
jgi:hypothetical protein